MAPTILLTCTLCGKEFSRLSRQDRNRKGAEAFCCQEHAYNYKQRFRLCFWDFVQKSDDPDGCWLWQGCIHANGYGYFQASGKNTYAHRYAYELTHGPIPKGTGHHGTVIRHNCDVPLCCRPDHLISGTQADNGKDRSLRERASTKLTGKQVIAIRGDTRSHRIIAFEYGVATSTISAIKTNRNWKYLTAG